MKLQKYYDTLSPSQIKSLIFFLDWLTPILSLFIFGSFGVWRRKFNTKTRFDSYHFILLEFDTHFSQFRLFFTFIHLVNENMIWSIQTAPYLKQLKDLNGYIVLSVGNHSI